jgi:hypothetical protein
VIDVREVGGDLNWFKQLKITFSALQVPLWGVIFFIVVFLAVALRSCRWIGCLGGPHCFCLPGEECVYPKRWSHLPGYTVTQPWRSLYEVSPPWKPRIKNKVDCLCVC